MTSQTAVSLQFKVNGVLQGVVGQPLSTYFDGNLRLNERESVSTYFETKSMKAGGDYANDHSGRRKNQASREIYFRGTDGR
jgi:hypothetical protein